MTYLELGDRLPIYLTMLDERTMKVSPLELTTDSWHSHFFQTGCANYRRQEYRSPVNLFNNSSNSLDEVVEM